MFTIFLFVTYGAHQVELMYSINHLFLSNYIGSNDLHVLMLSWCLNAGNVRDKYLHNSFHAPKLSLLSDEANVSK